MKRLLLAALLLSPALVHAQPDTAEAGKRFNAGVALYNEADYTAALVEFKRAYAIAPNFVVLYNIGQTHYQLQDYANAYLVLTQFLAEAPPEAEHRAEVVQTVELLKSRIGKIDVTTTEPGAEVTIDSIAVGKTPLPSPVLVSIGKRTIVVSAPGKETQTRIVEISAGDLLRQEIVLVAPAAPVSTPVDTTPMPAETSSRGTATKIAWISTGVLAASAVTFGVLAWRAEGDLDDLRATYPVTRGQLTDQADKVQLYSTLGDVLGVATLLVGGTALVLTLTADDDSTESSTKVSVGPGGLIVAGSF